MFIGRFPFLSPRSYFLLPVLAHLSFCSVLVVCIVPAIKRLTSALVEDRQEARSPFSSVSFHLRVCEATRPTSLSFIRVLTFRLNDIANARSSPSLVLAIARPRHRPSPSSPVPIIIIAPRLRASHACGSGITNRALRPPHPLSRAFPFREQARFYLLKSKPRTLNIGFLPTLQYTPLTL